MQLTTPFADPPLKGEVIRLVMFEGGFGVAFRRLGVEGDGHPPLSMLSRCQYA